MPSSEHVKCLIIGSGPAGYTAAGQHLNSETANWAYVVEGDFPYSNWMAWYLYSAKGVPLFKFSDSTMRSSMSMR